MEQNKYDNMELRTDLLEGASLLGELGIAKVPPGLYVKMRDINEGTDRDGIKAVYEMADKFYRTFDEKTRPILKALLREPFQRSLSGAPMGTRHDVVERLKAELRQRGQTLRERNIMRGPGARPITYASTIKIFVDMDTTLTNFPKAVKEIGGEAGLSPDATDIQKQDMYDRIENAGPGFWAKMEWMPDGRALWDAVSGYNPTLLSSPGEFRYAPAGKQQWVSENLPGTSLFLDTEKWRYAERDAILIDDDKDNVGAWEESGGIGILHADAPATVEKLYRIISNRKLAAADVLRKIASRLFVIS